MFRTAAPAVLLALSACSASGLDGTAGLDSADLGEVIEGEFMISADLPSTLTADLGLEKVDFDKSLQVGLYKALDSGVSRAAIEATLKEKVRDTLRVEHNRPVSARATDPFRSLQWNMDMLEIETAWDYTTGAGVTVAVVDTGVSWYGEDKPVNLVAGWDYVDGDADPEDENGHGTHVAGTIAQATGNGKGVVGMAPDATILVYRTLDANGSGSVYWTSKAITAAADAGADVINLSLGSPYATGTEEDAIAYAVDRGVVVVAASGNSGKGSLDYPARYADTIAVGAVKADAGVTSYSNGGTGLDLVAPGGSLSYDQNGDDYADGVLQETLRGYEFFEGTSMATPHVAGAAALLIAAGASPYDVREILVSTADDLEGSGWDKWSGYGLLDVVSALQSVEGAPPADDGDDEPPSSADTVAPVISDVAGVRSGSSLTLTWTTDEPSTTELEFQEYGWFGDTDNLTTSHEMTFTIDPNAAYYFTVVATDAAGNTSTDGTWVSNP